MDGFLEFNRGVMQLPVHWQLWMMLLVSVNLLIPLFSLKRTEARYTLLAMVLSMVLFSLLTAQFGFTRILGVGHLPWVPLLIYLWKRLKQVPAGNFYGVWMRSLMGLNLISLVIDSVDVTRYLLGKRGNTVVGLIP